MANDFQSVADFDIIDFAKKILGEVDQIRSYEFDQADNDTSQKEHKPIESRVNAFFRLIGLPMFVSIEKRNKNNKSKPSGNLSGERNLTPGYYGNKFSQYILQNTEKDDDLSFSLAKRESTLLDRENKVGTQEMDDAMTQAMRYAIPLAPNVEGIVGPNGALLNYKDSKKAPAGCRKVFKKIFPLVTSYIKVTPVKNETARPFLQYTKDQMPDSQTKLPKSFIETVIRIRLVTAANAENSAGKAKADDIKKAIQKDIGDKAFASISAETNSVLSSVDSGGMLENLILRRLLSSLPQLAKKWNELLKNQELLYQKIKCTISVRTTSAQNSPFGKRTTSAEIILNPESEFAQQIQALQKKLAKDQAIQMLLPSDDTILGSDTNAKNMTKNTVFMNLVIAFIKLLTPDIDDTQDKIKKIEDQIQKTNQRMEALRLELEMMTGEFTGLSVIDIVSIIIALFTISKQELVSLLDRDTIDEMKKDKVLAAALESLNLIDGLDTAKGAVDSLEKTVTWIFDLLNTYIKTNSDRSARAKDAKNVRSVTKSLNYYNDQVKTS
ncbi:MAG: hypothetical protein WC516_07340 [Patescibacteria group bacterium]|jgi:hypothetical protein